MKILPTKDRKILMHNSGLKVFWYAPYRRSLFPRLCFFNQILRPMIGVYMAFNLDYAIGFVTPV